MLRAEIYPGAIAHVFCPYLKSEKFKFLIVGYIDEEKDLTLGFFINSRIDPLLAKQTETLKCQIPIDGKTHRFLRKQSYIEASSVQEKTTFSDLLREDTGYRGKLKRHELVQLVSAIRSAPTIGTDHKEVITQALEQSLKSFGLTF